MVHDLLQFFAWVAALVSAFVYFMNAMHSLKNIGKVPDVINPADAQSTLFGVILASGATWLVWLESHFYYRNEFAIFFAVCFAVALGWTILKVNKQRRMWTPERAFASVLVYATMFFTVLIMAFAR